MGAAEIGRDDGLPAEPPGAVIRSDREREITLAAAPDFVLPDLSGVSQALVPLALERFELLAVYYDARDLRLARSGVTLRHRSDEGWTLTLPVSDPSDGSLLVRRAYRTGGAPGAPPDALLARARAWLRHEPAVLIAELRTVRERVRLVDTAEAVVADIVSDQVAAPALRGRATTRFREVKVEMRSTDTHLDVLERLEARLRRAGAVSAPSVPKVARALGLLTSSPDMQVVPGDATAAEAVRSVIARSVHRFLLHDPGLVGGENPEDVHQARVALRRLRSDLHTFAPLLDPEPTARLRGEAGWFASLLGGVRDADVMAARLRRSAAALPMSDQAALESLLTRQEAERSAARDALLAGRCEERFLDLVDALVAAAAATPPAPAALAPAPEVLSGLVRRPWRRVCRARAAMSEHPTDAELHRLRIKAKRLRYAAEAAASVDGRRARRLARAAAALQDVLGEHQDAVVLGAWLRACAAAGPAPVALVAGELVVGERERATRMREEWPAAWRRLARRGAAWRRADD